MAGGVAPLAHGAAGTITADAIKAVSEQAIAVGVARRPNSAALVDARRAVRCAAPDRRVTTVGCATAVLTIDCSLAVPALALDVAATRLPANLSALPIDGHLPGRAFAAAAGVADLAALAVATAAASVGARDDGAGSRLALGSNVAKLTQAAARIAQAVLAAIGAVGVAVALDAPRAVAATGRTSSAADFRAADRRAIAVELRFAVV